MSLQTATLVPGSETPAGDGYTQATRCVLLTQDGKARAAILKRLPRTAVMAEAFSAVLLKAWGLNVPDPFLVPDGQALHFASADATYPSLKQRLGLGGLPDGELKDALTRAACHIVAGLEQTPLALMADEAIDNRDRNLGNILWDGTEAAWIDHELALGLAQHLPSINKLAAMVQQSSRISSIQQSAVAAWIAADRDAAQRAALHTGPEAHALAEQVAARLVVLGGKILARFPAPNDLLSQA